MFGKRNVATVVAEFLGTGVLTLLILSVQRSQLSLPFFVAAAGGLAMAVMVFTLPRATAGFFNPAITVAFWIARRIPTISAILFVLAQILGAWGAYYLFTYFVKNPLMPVGGKFNWHIFAAEAVGSGIFGLGIAAAVYQRASTAATAAFAGLSLMIGMIAASSASLALLNPAVALGVRAVV